MSLPSIVDDVFVLEAEADTLIRTDLGIRRNDNYGKDKGLIVGTGRGGGNIPFGGADAMRSLLQFDLSDIPTKTVENATLELTIFGYDRGLSSSQYTVDIYKILEPWEEGNGYEGPLSGTIGAPPGAVWVDPAEGVAWAGAGDNPDPEASNNQTQPEFDPVVVASTSIEQGVDSRGEVIQWDITSLVNDWLSGTVPNHGILLRDTTTDGTFRGVVFGSREGGFWDFPGTTPEPVTEPRLVISLVPGNITGTPGDDRLRGTDNDDQIFGLAGDDRMRGRDGNDEMLGGDGDDRMRGDDDNDTLIGGDGDDVLFGDDGSDIFVLAAGEGTDVIRDFELSEGDQIGLAGGLQFNQLSFESDKILLGTEVLAEIRGFETSSLTSSNFVTI